MATELTVNQPPQPAQNAQSNAPVYGGATGAVNKTPDSVVTNTAKTQDSDVGEDRGHRNAAQQAAARRHISVGVPRLENLTDSNVKTVVGFDAQDADHIYIRVQDANTGAEIAQIPSKEFLHFLRQRFNELFGGSGTEEKGISQSV